MLRERITHTFEEVFRDSTGSELAAVGDDTILLETGLDSLGFAILVTRLHDDLGFDPFTLAPDAYYPVTFGEFVAFYEEHRPQ